MQFLPYQRHEAFMRSAANDLQENISASGVLRTLTAAGKSLLFYCAFGERSAMALQAAQDAGINAARHIEGGIDA